MLYVASYRALYPTIKDVNPSHLISLLDPRDPIPTPPGINPRRHLKLGVNDITEPLAEYIAPDAGHVGELLRFIDTWKRGAPLLIHCWAGVSRSTAAAYVALCRFNEPGLEVELARRLRAAAPHANPNRLIVALADDLLGRDGRMIEAIGSLDLPAFVDEGPVFSIEVEHNAANS